MRFDAVYLDASAAIMLFTREEGYKNLQKFMQNPDESPTVFMTAFCVTETLSAIKTKWRNDSKKTKKNPDEKQRLQAVYFSDCNDFLSHLRDDQIHVNDIPIADREIYKQVEPIAINNEIDLVDAFQIVTLQRGLALPLRSGQSELLLILKDAALINPARELRMKVWDCKREASPPV